MRLSWPRRDVRHDEIVEGVLGTALQLRIVASTRGKALDARDASLREVDRLEGIFSRYREDSELRVWSRTRERRAVSSDLAFVLREARAWWQRSNGAFHPGAGLLADAWREAARRGERPSLDVLAVLARTLRDEPFEIDERGARNATPGGPDLNAIAKGYIVDRAVNAALAVTGVSSVLVNIGGDLRHAGHGEVRAGITDPFASADNARPLDVVTISNSALATSGNVHRGFDIGGTWYSHVLDPRTGEPVSHVVSASVLAKDALTADVLATIVGVVPPHEGLRLADDVGVGVLLVTSDRARHTNRTWPPTALTFKETV
ncbi:FAD:protein FMN transferase [Deinococcus yavapaiensis]|uniref:FAD:protein FMN transferase n=1 Tax=Deinococcus yavapaiensis KR-236 TaxID=694435 RepID=A0A318S877_9DEIO|nr:FAD:protein FMN transferase [Deinococcus yavapaiensis]PYE53253.1 thiamine biosynthesis lipoprotein [Deinococcus yavapaiensis KR-236]